MVQRAAYEADLMTALATGVHDRLGMLAAAGGDPSRLGSPSEVAGRMLAVVPVAHPWDAQIGPFYDTAGLTKLLGVTKQALADRVRRHRLLAVTTAEGRVLYPVRQFAGRRLVEGLPDVLAAFRLAPVDGWAVAAWLTTPAVALDGVAPLDRLLTGHEDGAVARLALETASRWSGE